ncbi:MAG: hypothetical protein LBT59_05400 [Clostridiales bacterium]|nr:hypothetical protein [Clostridiales bacterium]
MSDIFDFLILIAIIVGSILVIAALASMAHDRKNGAERRRAEQEAIHTLNTAVGEADDAVAEMDKMAKSIFKEMEDKHQELLFLFSLIEGKKGEVAEKHRAQSSLKNPKLGKIQDLYDKGLSVEEIARALAIGQGEVNLILNLGKGR